jgi:hypothetical protein
MCRRLEPLKIVWVFQRLALSDSSANLSLKLFRVLNDEMCYSTTAHCMVMSRKPSAYLRSQVSILLTEKNIYFYM